MNDNSLDSFTYSILFSSCNNVERKELLIHILQMKK